MVATRAQTLVFITAHTYPAFVLPRPTLVLIFTYPALGSLFIFSAFPSWGLLF